MSYNIYLTISTGGTEEAEVAEVGNMTSNVSPMWRKALGFPLGDLHGRKAGECIADLERAVAAINDPAALEEYRAMNPPNGWGSHEGAANYLGLLLAACRAHPLTTVRISR
jgi:hypothetical protein